MASCHCAMDSNDVTSCGLCAAAPAHAHHVEMEVASGSEDACAWECDGGYELR